MLSKLRQHITDWFKVDEPIQAGRWIIIFGLIVAGFFLAQYELPPHYETLKQASGVPHLSQHAWGKRGGRFTLEGIAFSFGGADGGRSDVNRWLDSGRHTVVLYADGSWLRVPWAYSRQTIWEIRSANGVIRSQAEIAQSRTLNLLGGLALGGAFVGAGVAYRIHGHRKRKR
jgi:hypothetical protein